VFRRQIEAVTAVGGKRMSQMLRTGIIRANTRICVRLRKSRATIIAPVVVASTVFTVGAFGVSNAYAGGYRCYNAVNCNGPNEGMNGLEARNESGTGLVARLWALENGQYVLKAIGSCSGCSAGDIYIPYLEVLYAHGETERWYDMYTYTLGGTQFIQT
jgi:hypothetical protein